MKNTVPSYLTEKKNVVWTVCGTAMFAELFILIYQPFGSAAWTDNPFVYIGSATAVVLVAMGVIAVSRTIMYAYAKGHDVQYWEYAIWLLSEVLAMTVIYSLTAVVVTGDYEDYFLYFNEALVDTVFTLFIPYAAFTMSFALVDKDRQLKALGEKLAGIEAAAQTDDESVRQTEVYNFRDEKSELKLSVRAETVYYIESSDNYVVIHYQNSDKMVRYMLRNTLKRIEKDFEGTALVRCNRSYMVNFNTIKVLSKTADGLMIDFGTDKLPRIPISKTYSARFLKKFEEERVGEKRQKNI